MQIKNKNYSQIICVIVLNTLFITTNVNVNEVAAVHSDDITIYNNIIDSWAEKFGLELKELSTTLAKTTEIKEEYGKNEVTAENVTEDDIMPEIMEGLNAMFKERVDAIKCIADKAEIAAKNFIYDESKRIKYYSSQHSFVKTTDDENKKCKPNNKDIYEDMILEANTDFFNLSVNTNHSAVHIPNSMSDEDKDVRKAISWTNALDETFRKNYEADPSLHWQYFCSSSTGILRHYPAKGWRSHDNNANYDCRKEPWYIETTTGPKEIIVLFDNTDSMSTFAQEHAGTVLQKILDTFTSHDRVNVFLYAEKLVSLVESFNEALVPAAPEYVKAFKDKVGEIKFDEDGDIGQVYAYSLELLKRARESRNVNESGNHVNQAIILITSEIDEDLDEVINKYNKFEGDDSTNVPVRLFTYVLDEDELSNINELESAACKNRGHFSLIRSDNEIDKEIFKYLEAFTRPLVLQGDEHPAAWTTLHHEQDGQKGPIRSWITVGVPVFNKNENNYTAENTKLLGVASTDILIDDINKLLLPYLVGVNGYAFIVDRAGYVVTHPNLDVEDFGVLKRNFGSVDITEVLSFAEDDNYPAELLRGNAIHPIEVSYASILSHIDYEDEKRVINKTYKYYFNPIPHTIFSLGIARPDQYGTGFSKINVSESDEIDETNIIEYFTEQDWKVHPDWIYCKYRMNEGHEFNSSEEELLVFLHKMEEQILEWTQQYDEANATENDGVCNENNYDDDSYYCNKKLLQLLFVDAKITNEIISEANSTDDNGNKLIELYDTEIQFISTSSGLTRWRRITNETDVKSTSMLFISRAIDEPWYKSAVLQYEIDSESSFYSISLNDNDEDTSNDQVTVTQAVMINDGHNDVPVAVSGFHIPVKSLKERFINITKESETTKLIYVIDSENVTVDAFSCIHTLIDCYIIDNNGFIVISDVENSIGKFFGLLEGRLMSILVDKQIFGKIILNDLNALCVEEKTEENDAMSLITPFCLAKITIQWLITEIFFYLSHVNIWVQSIPSGKAVHNTYIDCEEANAARVEHEQDNVLYRTCHKSNEIYILQQNEILHNKTMADETEQRPFYIKRIPYTNLLLVVVDNNYAEKLSVQITAGLTEVHHSEDYPLYKKLHNTTGSFGKLFITHPLESNETFCRNKGTILKIENIATTISILLFNVYIYFFHLNFS